MRDQVVEAVIRIEPLGRSDRLDVALVSYPRPPSAKMAPRLRVTLAEALMVRNVGVVSPVLNSKPSSTPSRGWYGTGPVPGSTVYPL